MSYSSLNLGSTRLGFLKSLNRFPPSQTRSINCFSYNLKFSESQIRKHGCNLNHNLVQIRAFGEDSDGISSFDDWGDSVGISGGNSYILSSSGEDSDTEPIVNPIGDVDLPSTNERFDSSDGAIAVTAHRFGMLRRRRKTNRIQPGVLINTGLVAFSLLLLLLTDWCSWRIVRLPLPPFYLSRPFLISAVLASIAGGLFIPILDNLSIHQTIRKEGPLKHSSKKGTPTMGGLFFIPIGVSVARFIAGFSSVEVRGAAAATLAFAAIGLLDDFVSFFKNHNYGLPAWIKLLFEVAVGLWFSFWLDSANISSPYSMYSFS